MLFKKDILLAKIQMILIINLIFWFLMASDPRFVYGFLFLGFSLTTACLFKYIKSPLYKIIKYGLSICIFLIVCTRISYPIEIIRDPMLCIISSPFETAKTKEYISDIHYRIPVAGGRWFYCELPMCTFPSFPYSSERC
jgi:hypothetical protein